MELGWYVVDHGALQPLAKSESLVKAGSLGHVVYGLKVEGLSSVVVRDPKAYFVVYTVDAPGIVESIKLTRLSFTGDREVKDPNLPSNFQRRGPIRFNAYTPQNPIRVGVTPVAGDSRMFKILPKEPLTEGVYALHLGEMEGAPFDRLDVYDFVVRTGETRHDLTGSWTSIELSGRQCEGVNSILCTFETDGTYSCDISTPQTRTDESGNFKTDGETIRLEMMHEGGVFVSWASHYAVADDLLTLDDGPGGSRMKFRRILR